MSSVTRARGGLVFHGRFYGLRNFCCKTAQLCATPCEPACLWFALKNTLRNILKNGRKSPSLNYKSAALDQLGYAGKNAPKLSVESQRRQEGRTHDLVM